MISFITKLPRSLQSLILSSFLVALGSFMVTPFLSIFLKETIKMDLKLIGTVMALATFIQFGGGIFGAMIAERFGLKKTMVYTLSFRTVGFFLLSLSMLSPGFVIPAVLIIAAGSAIYMPANKAYMVSSVSSELKPLFLSISSASLNAGMALGPLAASYFISDRPANLFLGITVLFILITIFHQKGLDSETPHNTQTARMSLAGFKVVWPKIWKVVVFNIITFYLYFYFQNFMGLYVSHVAGVKVFGWVMLLNFVILFVLQLKLHKFIAAFSYRKILSLSFILMGLGLLIVSLGSTPFLLLGTAIMTVGQSFLFLRGEIELVSNLKENPAMAFGIQRLSAGVGGALSGLLGGFVYDHYSKINWQNGFWINVGIQCAVAGIISYLVINKKRDRNENRNTVSPYWQQPSK